MILASVITCPQRWESYQRLRRNFAALGFGFPLRTFQTKERAGDAYANNNLNARAALAYAARHLPADGWLLYLEDDVVLSPELPILLPNLVEIGQRERVDCWYLCNRKNPVAQQHRSPGFAGLEFGHVSKRRPALSSPSLPLDGGEGRGEAHSCFVINELTEPVLGAHALLIPHRHLARMLTAHWSDVSDQAMFAAIRHPGLRLWQVIKPVLVEHVGVVSTYVPHETKVLEVNPAD